MSKKKSFDGLSLREQIKPIFKERYLEMLKSEENYLKYEDCILTPQRKSFRVNFIKVKDETDLIKKLKAKGFDFEPVPWSKGGYFVKFDKEKRIDLGNLFEHFLGEIYVQEATSMIPPEVLEIPEDIPENFTVLDMASSPGSKTTQIGSYMKNKGTIYANELDYKRLGPLKINLERSGLTNIILLNSDGSRIEGEELFDRILLDAPCSGSGVIRKSPGTIRSYNPNKLKSISNLQKKLLERAFALLKKGGVLIYSTCSLEPEEDEFLIQDFLKNHSTARLGSFELNGIVKADFIGEFNGFKIEKEIYDKTIKVWPHLNDTNGFFVAKIMKD